MSIYRNRSRKRDTTTPFVYLLYWSHTNAYYIGSKSAKWCHPDDLWTVYFTSSDFVRTYAAKHGDPDYRLVVSTFDNPEDAVREEARVLASIDAANHPDFLNLTSGAGRLSREAQARVTAKALARWQDPTYRETRLAQIREESQRPERNAALSAALKRHYAEEENRQRAAEQTKRMWANPETRTILEAERKARMKDPAKKAQAAENGRNAHKDPAVKERMREAARERWKDPVHRARMVEAARNRKKRP